VNQLSSKRKLLVLAALLMAMLLVIYVPSQTQPVPKGEPLVDIQSIETLRTQFNQDAGKTRLILLLSPT
jgi:hypothetical protein